MRNILELELWRSDKKVQAEEEYMGELADIEKDYLDERNDIVKREQGKKFNLWFQFNDLKPRIIDENASMWALVLNLKHRIPSKIFMMRWEDDKLVVLGRMGEYRYWLEVIE